MDYKEQVKVKPQPMSISNLAQVCTVNTCTRS